MDDESGSLVRQRRKEVSKYQWTSTFACKKCDKVLESDQQFRKHIKEHNRLQNEVIKCHHCIFTTNDETIHINHMVDIHGTKHTCLSCQAVFPSKGEMINHAGDVHALKYSSNETNYIKCHYCEESLSSKVELYNHKKRKHFKKRLCSYYHGNGWGCRFIEKCLDIHNGNITPELTDDKRGKIPCSYGNSCYYNSRNTCHYLHTQNDFAPSAPPLDTE